MHLRSCVGWPPATVVVVVVVAVAVDRNYPHLFGNLFRVVRVNKKHSIKFLRLILAVVVVAVVVAKCSFALS